MQQSTAKAVETAYPWEQNYLAGIDWNVAIEAAPLHKILEDAAAKFSNRTAVRFGEMKQSYAALDEMASKIAAGLQKLGVAKGDKVGMFLPNVPYFVAFYHGILKAGATVVNYNPLYVERELASQIADSETDYLVTLDEETLFGKADNVLQDTRLKGLIVCPADGKTTKAPAGEEYIRYETLIDNDGQYNPVTIDPQEDIAVLQYTGGTTGVPKGAMLTHANLYINTMQIAMWHNPVMTEEPMKMVSVIPLFHVFAMTVCMNMSLSLGMEIILVPKFDPESLIGLLKKEQPDFLPAVPAVFNAIISHPLSEDLDLSCIKFSLSGGAPIPGEVKRGYEEKTGARLGEGYGLTEASPVVTCNPVEGEIILGSIGMPIPGTLVEIVSMEDGETVLPLGEKGEVCVRGPQVMKGYYNKEEETAQTIRNGRLHTGDVGYMDEKGYVYLVDRLKDLILVRGYNVYPRQVEEAIYLHPSVEECIVAGVPDETRGETVWAWVKPLDGKELGEEELKEFLKDKLSPIEIPRKVVVRTTPLPKTAVGKLSRKLLLEEENIRKS